MALAEEDLSDQPRRRTVPERFAAIDPTRAGQAGAALWIGAIVALILFTHGEFFGPLGFTLTECWLVGVGCLGNPILMARALRDGLTPAMCLNLSGMSGVAAILLTVLFAAGQVRVAPVTGAFSVILPEAFAIQLFNGSDALTRVQKAVTAERRRAKTKREHAVHAALDEAERRRDLDVRAAYLGAMAECYQAPLTLEELLAKVLKLSSDDIKTLCETLPEVARRELYARGDTDGLPLIYGMPNGAANGAHRAKLRVVDEEPVSPAPAATEAAGADDTATAT